MPEMTGTVLDILIYVFDRYMLADTPDVPERDELALDLERAGSVSYTHLTLPTSDLV